MRARSRVRKPSPHVVRLFTKSRNRRRRAPQTPPFVALASPELNGVRAVCARERAHHGALAPRHAREPPRDRRVRLIPTALVGRRARSALPRRGGGTTLPVRARRAILRMIETNSETSPETAAKALRRGGKLHANLAATACAGAPTTRSSRQRRSTSQRSSTRIGPSRGPTPRSLFAKCDSTQFDSMPFLQFLNSILISHSRDRRVHRRSRGRPSAACEPARRRGRGAERGVAECARRAPALQRHVVATRIS